MLVCAQGEEGVEAEAQVTGTRAHLPAERPPRLSGRRREPAAPPAYINPQLLLSRLAVSGCRPPGNCQACPTQGPKQGRTAGSDAVASQPRLSLPRWPLCSGFAPALAPHVLQLPSGGGGGLKLLDVGERRGDGRQGTVTPSSGPWLAPFCLSPLPSAHPVSFTSSLRLRLPVFASVCVSLSLRSVFLFASLACWPPGTCRPALSQPSVR